MKLKMLIAMMLSGIFAVSIAHANKFRWIWADDQTMQAPAQNNGNDAQQENNSNNDDGTTRDDQQSGGSDED